eukprot:366166-Chlamydomonas_euryale.AAC.18
MFGMGEGQSRRMGEGPSPSTKKASGSEVQGATEKLQRAGSGKGFPQAPQFGERGGARIAQRAGRLAGASPPEIFVQKIISVGWK